MNESRTSNTPHELALRSSGAVCRITIEPGRLAALGATARRAVADAHKTLLVADEAVLETHSVKAQQSLEQAGFEVVVCPVNALESQKTLASVESVYAAMVEAGLERRSPVVAVGGGVVCDVAGFAAATYQRGVPIVMAPTTLLAMVDASIGGKNGVNFGVRRIFKNMIGTVWQPRAILIDPEVLATLPERHVRCGLAECIKVAMLRDAALVPMITEAPAQIREHRWEQVAELVAKCAAIKASIVEADEREELAGYHDSPNRKCATPDHNRLGDPEDHTDSVRLGAPGYQGGGRAILNLGHTFAHAFELIESLALMHGEAVAIGMCAAVSVARRMGRIEQADEQRWRQVISSVGLPTQLPGPVPVATLLECMRRDKKVRLGKLRLVLPTAGGGAALVEDVDENLISAALLEIGGG